MERENYIDSLKRCRIKLPSLAIDTEFDKGVQTNNGFWIDERFIRKQQQKQRVDNRANDQSHQQVSLGGCVQKNVKRTDLISDRRGGYFVHVNSSDLIVGGAVPRNIHGSDSNQRYQQPYQQPYNRQNKYHPYNAGIPFPDMPSNRNMNPNYAIPYGQTPMQMQVNNMNSPEELIHQAYRQQNELHKRNRRFYHQNR